MPLSPKSRPGVREIAASLGMGKSTVARALRQDPRVAPETRARVAAEARRIGYVDTPELRAAMRALRGGRPNGHTLAAYHHPRARAAVSRAIMAEVEGAAERLGYGVTWHEAWPKDLASVKRRVLHGGCRGVLGCMVDGVTSQQLQETFGDSVPVVAWSHCPVPEVRVTQVGYRLASAARLTFHHARAAGYRRIGLVAQPGLVDPLGEFEACWEGALRAHGLAGMPPLRPLKTHVFVPMEEGLDGWLREHEPDCVVSFHHEVVETARKRADWGERGWIYVRKRDVPSAVECAGLDTRPERQAQQAVWLLVDACERGSKPDGEIHLVEPRWSPGPTLRTASTTRALEALPFAEGAPAGRVWRTLDLGEVANQPFGGPGGGLATRLHVAMPAGRVELAGVPFELRGDATHGRRSFLWMASAGHERGAHGVLPDRASIDAGGVEADEVYLLHGCAWARDREAFACYVAVHEDGTREELPVRAPGHSREPTCERARAEANVHDAWSAAFVLENADTRPVWLHDHVTASECEAHFYLHRWRLRGRSRVKALEVRSSGNSETQLALIAATLGRLK